VKIDSEIASGAELARIGTRIYAYTNSDY